MGKRPFFEKPVVLAPKMLRKGAGWNDSGPLDIRNMTRMDSTKAAVCSGCGGALDA
jgi:hypothetical protein